MTFEEKKQRAELLVRQIRMMEEQLERLYDEMTRERFWLKAGDIIKHSARRRGWLLGKVNQVDNFYLVDRITSVAPNVFRSDRASVWVHPICWQTGLVDRATVGTFQHYQLDQLHRIGHTDDLETERIDISILKGNQ